MNSASNRRSVSGEAGGSRRAASRKQSRWDLLIVDEVREMSAYGEEKKTLAYHLGEAPSGRTDHYLVAEARPP